jgi:tRNA1Val (adenine37-N6)-methyltransferase
MNYFLSLHSFYIMSNDYFAFKRFVVHQQRCAMKVGTDGCLLGAWANGGQRILDVGTGTGLIAMMMAQRFPESSVMAVDIDSEAVLQAQENVDGSPFRKQITVQRTDFLKWDADGKYNAIVSNPPFFIDSLTSPDAQRSVARHTVTLTYEELMRKSYALLSDEGECSVVVPFDCRSRMEGAAAIAGFVLSRVCAVKTTERKPPRRYLLAFRKGASNGVESTELVIGSAEFTDMMHEFYLKM